MASSEKSLARDDITEEAYCTTEFKTKIISFLWTVQDFLCLPQKTGEFLTSVTFPATNEYKSKWILHLYPQGDESHNNDYVSIFLRLKESTKTLVLAEFKVAIFDAKGKKTNITPVDEAGTFELGTAWGIERFIERERLIKQQSNLLSGGNMSIYCEVSEIGIINTSDQTKFLLQKTPSCNLSEEIGKLYENSEFSDVTLNINGREIFAHKAILSARSPVFSAMFTHAMQENDQNIPVVNIRNIPYEVMKELVHFIYSGKVQNLNKFSYDLFSAANKYGLEQLKQICEKEIASSISIENAAIALVLADVHNADDLKSYLIDFITYHYASVRKTVGWGNLVRKAPHLIEEVCFELTKHLLLR